MTINDLSVKIHNNNVEKGFYEEEKNIGEMLALIHSEVSEALECDRKNKYANLPYVYADGDEASEDWKEYFGQNIKDTFEDELADIIIRVLDLAAFKDIDIENHIRAKVAYNTTRPHKHGKKY